jgi:hypothetical protein
MKIKASLYLFYTPRDRSGNVYWGFRYIDHETGYRAAGQAPAESNCVWAMHELGLESGEYLYCIIPMEKRRYKQDKSFGKYVGSDPKEIANYIRKCIDAKQTEC